MVSKMFVTGLQNCRTHILDLEGNKIYDLTKFARRIGAINEIEIMSRVREFMEKNPRYENMWKNCIGELSSQQDLSKTLNVSLSTIQRDMDDLKNKSLDWVDGLTRGDFIHHAQVASMRIDNQIARLQDRIKNENLDPKTEAFLMKTINEFVRMQIDMEIHPVYQLLKKIDYRLGQIPPKLRTWQNQ